MLTTKAFCGKCGAMVSGESGKSHTGTVHYYYKCGNHKRNGRAACDLQAVRKEPLELFVVKAAVQKVLQPKVMDRLCDLVLAYQKQENTRLPLLQKQLQEVKKKIGNLIAAIEQGILTPSTKQRMDELEQQRQQLETSILQEQIEKPPITREQILFWFDHFRHGDPKDPAFQQQVIDCFVNAVYLFDDKIVLVFNYKECDQLVTLEEVKSSILDDNASPKTLPQLRLRERFLLPYEESNRAAHRSAQKQSSGLFFSPREIPVRVRGESFPTTTKSTCFLVRQVLFLLFRLFVRHCTGIEQPVRPRRSRRSRPGGTVLRTVPQGAGDSPYGSNTAQLRLMGHFFASVRGIAAQATAACGGSSLPAQKKNGGRHADLFQLFWKKCQKRTTDFCRTSVFILRFCQKNRQNHKFINLR